MVNYAQHQLPAGIHKGVAMSESVTEIERQIERIHLLREMRAAYNTLHEKACVMVDQEPKYFRWKDERNRGGTLAVARELKQRVAELAAEEKEILETPMPR